jgi:hypothetical protein
VRSPSSAVEGTRWPDAEMTTPPGESQNPQTGFSREWLNWSLRLELSAAGIHRSDSSI